MTDLLLVVVGAVATGIVGYFVGKSQARSQVFYGSQAEALTELRVGFLSLAEEYKGWVSMAEGATYEASGLPNPKEVSRITTKAGELAGDLGFLRGEYGAYKPYLGARTREVLDSLIDEMDRGIGEIAVAVKIRRSMAQTIEERYEEGEPNYYDAALRRATRDAWAWASGKGDRDLDTLLGVFEREVERAVGNRSWWLRLFGG